jgi:ribonuclease HI
VFFGRKKFTTLIFWFKCLNYKKVKEEERMSQKLIIYVDGSYRDNKGGWSYTYKKSKDNDRSVVSYGSCDVKNSNQSEIIACIKALESLKPNLDIEYVEIRSDYLDLVRVMNKVAQFHFMSFAEIKNLLGKENELHTIILAKLIIECTYNVKFYKASKKDVLNAKVHNLAKKVIDSEKPNENCDSRQYQDLERNNSISKEQRRDEFIKYLLHIWESRDGFSYKDIPDLREKLVEIDVSKVILCDEIHFKANSVEFDGLLYQASKKNQIYNPIVVRSLGNDQYGLVLGLKSFCVARMLGINKMKAYITDLSRRELIMKTLNISS